MNIIKSKFFYIIICLLGVLQCLAAPTPPAPGAKKPPSPPGLPIDDGLLYVFIIAIAYGLFITIKNQINTKNSI